MSEIRDGDLFKVVRAFGRDFVIRYGYYEDFERARGEPVPIYPDFRRDPEYTEEGNPFVTQMQELCEHGDSKFREGCCVDCRYYGHGDDLIGICTCERNKRNAST